MKLKKLTSTVSGKRPAGYYLRGQKTEITKLDKNVVQKKVSFDDGVKLTYTYPKNCILEYDKYIITIERNSYNIRTRAVRSRKDTEVDYYWRNISYSSNLKECISTLIRYILVDSNVSYIGGLEGLVSKLDEISSKLEKNFKEKLDILWKKKESEL